MTFFIFLLACSAAAATGIIFKPGAWYESLQKPAFTPPNWAFPVAWTTIY
ncbi:tryptophan-rich sensory protein, partial [Pseudomonas viridiflava]